MTYKPEGDPATAKIVLVGEAPSTNEMLQGRPFVGEAGRVVNELMSSAGMNRSAVYITNVFNDQLVKPKKKDEKHGNKNWRLKGTDEQVWRPQGKVGFLPAAEVHIARLQAELRNTNANVIVPLGGTALRALTEHHEITKWRGSIIPSIYLGGRKLVPTFHPATTLYGGNYLDRYYIVHDLRRAVEQSNSPAFPIIPYQFMLYPTHSQCLAMLRDMGTCDRISADIEVEKRQVSFISFSWKRYSAIPIPYSAGRWTAQEELELWQETARLFANPRLTKLFHNAGFDVVFLLRIHRIHVKPPLGDTMLAYHTMYGEFRKSLAAIASMYTLQAYWKDMVNHFSDVEKVDG